MKRACIGLLALLLAIPVWSHDGEDHAAAPAALPSATTDPRTSAASEEFELVAMLTDKKLTLYLDRYASNAPVADAQIELESGAIKHVAAQIAPGVYALPGEAFRKPGKYPLLFSIQTADSADLLAATLEVAQPVAGVAPAKDTRLVWGTAGALLLAGVGVVVLMRRRK